MLAATNWFLGILNGLIIGLDTIAIGAIYKYKHREMQIKTHRCAHIETDT